MAIAIYAKIKIGWLNVGVFIFPQLQKFHMIAVVAAAADGCVIDSFSLSCQSSLYHQPVERHRTDHINYLHRWIDLGKDALYDPPG